MDIALARTFLTIIEAGSFIEAARRMNLTQSTVSSRVKGLEDLLGQPLFRRSKHGAVLTPAGEQFQRHALALVRAWQQAQLDVGRSGGAAEHLSVGAEATLWHGLLTRWVSTLCKSQPSRTIVATAGRGATLMQALRDGRLDLAVVYRPIPMPGLLLEHLFEEELVLVTTATSGRRRRPADYVLVDWGPDFRDEHAAAFPRFTGSRLTLDIGPDAIDYILRNDGAGYLPLRLVRRHLSAGRLRIPARSRRFLVPVGAVYPESRDDTDFDSVLRSLKSSVPK